MIGLFQPAWAALASCIKTQVASEEEAVSPLVSTLLQIFLERFEPGSPGEVATKTLVSEIIQDAIEQCERMLAAAEDPAPARVASLVAILDMFGGAVFSDPGLAEVRLLAYVPDTAFMRGLQSIDQTIHTHLHRLLRIAPALMFVYLTHRHDKERCTKLWQDVLAFVASQPEDFNGIVPSLLDAAERGRLPDYLDDAVGSLDTTAGMLLAEALAGPEMTSEAILLRRILCTPSKHFLRWVTGSISHDSIIGFFISNACFKGLVQSVCSAFSLHFQGVLRSASVSLKAFNVLIELIRALMESSSTLNDAEDALTSVMPDVFLFAYLLPTYLFVSSREIDAAQGIWETWTAKAGQSAREVAAAVIKQRVRELLMDCKALPT